MKMNDKKTHKSELITLRYEESDPEKLDECQICHPSILNQADYRPISKDSIKNPERPKI